MADLQILAGLLQEGNREVEEVSRDGNIELKCVVAHVAEQGDLSYHEIWIAGTHSEYVFTTVI